MTRWYTEKKREHYYKEAKREGYRARSAFKLLQIQKRFTIFSEGDIVVDLGAAPGGWTQVALKLVGSEGQVIGVDLALIQPLAGAVFLQGDMTDPVTQQNLLQQLQGKHADVVLSDMSPDISGNYSIDHARSIYLAEQAYKTSSEVLKQGGNFLCKLFEGGETNTFFSMLKRQFQIVKRFSPQASRKSSSEIYLIAKSYKKSTEQYKKE